MRNVHCETRLFCTPIEAAQLIDFFTKFPLGMLNNSSPEYSQLELKYLENFQQFCISLKTNSN